MAKKTAILTSPYPTVEQVRKIMKLSKQDTKRIEEEVLMWLRKERA